MAFASLGGNYNNSKKYVTPPGGVKKPPLCVGYRSLRSLELCGGLQLTRLAFVDRCLVFITGRRQYYLGGINH